jgi:transcriptional regulator with XRE-family HTH domain
MAGRARRKDTSQPHDAKAIGRRIYQARKETNGMIRDELANLVGVTSRSVANWEKGENIPHRYMSAIADITGTTVEWLYNGDQSSSEEMLLQAVESHLRYATGQLRDLILEVRGLRQAFEG